MAFISNRAYFCLFFLTLWKAATFCQIDQDFRFTNINDSQGLPNNSVNAIAKDDLGFIWIGTNDGLCRYEGPNVLKVFRMNNPQIDGGLQSNNIRSLFLDSKNNLWIGTRLGGVTRFHQQSDTWTTFRNDKNDPKSLCNDEILTITEDSKGRILIGTENGLSIYNEQTNSFFSFQSNKDKPGSLPSKAVLSILEDNNGWIWVGLWDGGLSLLMIPENGNIEQGEFRTFFPNDKKQARHIWKIFQDSKNRFWLGSSGAGVFNMNLPPNSHNRLGEPMWSPEFHNYINDGFKNSITHNDIKNIIQDKNGNLWIGTSNGLNFLSAKEMESLALNGNTRQKKRLNFQRYFHEFNVSTSIGNNHVRTLFEDDQGIIWAGTFGGVSQYNKATNQFDIHELHKVISKNPISHNLYIDKEGIAWFANGERGIIKYDFEKQTIEENVDIGLGNIFVSNLYSENDRHLYVGHMKGVSKFDMKTKSIKHFTLFENTQQQQRYSLMRSLFKDSKNRIWVGTENGLFIINENTGAIKLFARDINNPKSISDNTINRIYEDSNGLIWLATYQGLNQVIEIDSNNFEFKHFKHDPLNPDNSIPANRVTFILEIEGILYIAGEAGLSGYDLKKGNFTNFSGDGNNFSYQCIVKGKDGNIWGTTSEGIVHYDIKNKTFNKYEKRDGLDGVVFYLGSGVQDKNGLIYFGSQRGITRFDPKKIVRNDIPPPVHITDILRINPKGEIISNVTYSKELVLEHNEYFLSLDYAAINYNRSEKNQYAFMLEGFDDKWNYTSKKTPAVYTNLKHGTYTFKVKAANNDGVWNDKGASLRIIKKPAFWETWWFLLLSLILGILLIYLGVKFYTKNITEKNRALSKYNEGLNSEISQRKIAEAALQEQKLDLREANENLARSNKDLEQFAYIASHDLREPLGVVGNFVGLLKSRYKDKLDDEAFQYIEFAVDGVSRMSEQIKSILTFSRVSQNEMEFELTNLNELIATNLHDLSQKIKEKNVQFEVDDLPEIYCDKNLIKVCFNNLISNAIKFNENPSPLISIHYHKNGPENGFKFSVKDNGIGIDQAHKQEIFEIFKRLHNKNDYGGTGIGLSLCKRIIQRHGGDIWVESQIGKGTTFYFTINNKPNLNANKKVNS